MTRTRRTVSVILAAALLCVGLVLIFMDLTSSAYGATHKIFFWGGALCAGVGAFWLYSDLFGKD
jgi:hypothetical protein